jgi:hypothetical protein
VQQVGNEYCLNPSSVSGNKLWKPTDPHAGRKWGRTKNARLVWIMIRRRSTEKTFCNYLTFDIFSLGGRFWRQYSVRFSHSVVNDEPVDGRIGTSKSAYTKLSVSLNLFWAVINWAKFRWTVEACRPLNLQDGNTYFRSYNVRLIT